MFAPDFDPYALIPEAFAPRLEVREEIVCGLIAEQFPQWAGLKVVALVPGGWDNRSFRLGDEMLVRLPSARRYAGQPETEAAWLSYLAERLPLPVPESLELGRPGNGYPYPWSVQRWIPGAPVDLENGNPCRVAAELAGFLRALQAVDPAGGPEPGPRNFYRGAHLTVYARETAECLAELEGRIDIEAASRVWYEAVSASIPEKPVWVHGDVSAGNLLQKAGRLNAVIDFGCVAVGDPACDLAAAYTLFNGRARDVFRDAMEAGRDTWCRARGWVLWKALTMLRACPDEAGETARRALRTIEELSGTE